MNMTHNKANWQDLGWYDAFTKDDRRAVNKLAIALYTVGLDSECALELALAEGGTRLTEPGVSFIVMAGRGFEYTEVQGVYRMLHEAMNHVYRINCARWDWIEIRSGKGTKFNTVYSKM